MTPAERPETAAVVATRVLMAAASMPETYGAPAPVALPANLATMAAAAAAKTPTAAAAVRALTAALPTEAGH